MYRKFGLNFAVFAILFDGVLTGLSLLLAVLIRPYLPHYFSFISPYEYYPTPLFYGGVVTLWVAIFILLSVYDSERSFKFVDEIKLLVRAVAISTLILAGIFYWTFSSLSRWLIVTFILFNFIFLFSWRVVMRYIAKVWHRSWQPRRVLIAGAGKSGANVGELISRPESFLNFVGYIDNDITETKNGLPVFGKLNQVRAVVREQKIDDVVITLPARAYGEVNNLVSILHDLPVRVRVVPDYFSLALYRASVENFGGLSMINLRDPALDDAQRLIKRLVDLILGSLIAIIAFLPMLIIAIAIRLDSKGSVFFLQDRVGENGEIFTMYKFRTMIAGAETMQKQINTHNETGQIIHKLKDDPRITRVGRILRRTSLDEMPQLLNVLKGNMSLVGPRPELPWLAARYEPWQRKRLSVPQGITGWWQVNGRSDKPMHLHTDEDIHYVQNYSLWMDIYILLKTVWVVVRGKGAY